jgi:hypothetical protein
MRNFCRLILALILAGHCGEAAFAQNANVTAGSGSITIGGNVVSSGTVVFVPVDASGHGIAITKSGGGLSLPVTVQPTSGSLIGYSCPVSGGALSSCSPADACTATPIGFAYNITVYDTSTGHATSGQSATLSQVHGVCGTWPLDHYSAGTTVTTAGAFTFTQGTGAPSGTGGTNSMYADVTDPAHPIFYIWTGTEWGEVITSGVVPGILVKFTPAALCSAGSAALGLVIPPVNAPASGCSNASSSPFGYLGFHAAASVAETAYGVTTLPPSFSTASATVTFYADSTSGSAGWILGTYCLNANGVATTAPTYVTASQTAAVSSSTDGLASATFSSVIRNGVNSCNAGSEVAYSITRSTSDGLSGLAYLVGITWQGVN